MDASGRKRVSDREWGHLATRIQRSLHRRVKVHCVEQDKQMLDFITAALEEKLARDTRRQRARR